jgi:hypothetical protein
MYGKAKVQVGTDSDGLGQFYSARCGIENDVAQTVMVVGEQQPCQSGPTGCASYRVSTTTHIS